MQEPASWSPFSTSLFQRSLKSSWSHCILIVCLHTYLLHEPMSSSRAWSQECVVHCGPRHKLIASRFSRKGRVACRLPGLCCALAALCIGHHLLPRLGPFSVVSGLDYSRTQFLLLWMCGPPGLCGPWSVLLGPLHASHGHRPSWPPALPSRADLS